MILDQLTRTLARQTRVSRATARDRLDKMVHRILTHLRAGQPVEIPGIGKLIAPRSVKAKASPGSR
jgi:nucleoid DNA-binding protein